MAKTSTDSVLVWDKNGNEVQAPATFKLADETGTPKTSPQTIADEGTLTITLPEKALQVVFHSNAEGLEISQDSGLFPIPANGFILPVAGMGGQTISIENNTGAEVSFNFLFTMGA